MKKFTQTFLEKELVWWNALPFKDKAAKVIEAIHLLKGDFVDNHPSNLERLDVKVIYDYNFDHSSIVRSNILKDKDYVPYCIPCPNLQRYESKGIGKQMICPKCGGTTRFSKAFLDEWVKTYTNNSKQLKDGH